ncbi:MAG: TonB-dependent receptor plug domain-containing protein [Bacteroidales bacterium]|nr:TonB-dependent receptor plug domain-containing protein [Bacteroidales bacterium]
MKKILILLCLFLPLYLIAQQKVTISGYVYEFGSRESLPGITVYEPATRTAVTTNSYGFYSITLPYRDSLCIVFTCTGFRDDTLRLSAPEDLSHNTLLSKTEMLEGIRVTAERTASEQVQMSSIHIGAKEVKNIPILLGEKDVFKTLLLMPGVQSGTEGTSGIYVRGGGPDQNLIILDEAPIYNANHLLGFFSIFNGDAIKSVELIKGGFPARYGGRLSSVIDVQMKEGNKDSYHGEGGIGLISAHAMVEGPIVKGKSSFMVSARTTFFDLLAMPVMKIIDPSTTTGYYFFDLNAKFNYDFGRKDKLYVSAYWGRDKFHMTEVDQWEGETTRYNIGMYWQNATATARWNHLFTSKIFSNLSFVFSDYKMNVYDKYKDPDWKYSMDFNSGIRDYTLKYDLSILPTATHQIHAGASLTYHEARPSAVTLKEDTFSHKTKIMDPGLEFALYADDEINIKNILRINPGIRLVCFSVPGRTYFSPEPRLSVSVNILKNLAFKTSYARMAQSMLLLSTSTIGLPTDLWVPITKSIRPQVSHQVAAGIHYDWRKPGLAFSVEGYYKKMNHVIAYKEGASFFLDALEGYVDENVTSKQWAENVTTGQGWSYGVEFLVRRTAGKFTGWVGYTLSWTQQQFDDLNFGRKFFSRYDRRHDISIVLMYSPIPKINLSVAWVFASGNAVTLPTSTYDYSTLTDELDAHFYPNEYHFSGLGHGYFIENYGEKNNLRMEPFHHLDIGIQIIHQHKRNWQSIFEISIYNVYNQKNAFFYYVTTDYDWGGVQKQVLQKICIFPIIPSFTYHFKF